MRIIQRYVTIRLVWTSLLALFVLVALFSFFSLIDQLEDSGRGNYGVFQAITYVVLTMPRLAYELFPIASVIGAMATLGIMAQSSELDVIRTSGVSKVQLSFIMAKAGIVLVVIAIFVGEVLAPPGEERAQYMRSVALTKEIAMKTRFGFWARDGNSYVNIRKILPGNRVGDIYIYEFDPENRLRNSSHAVRAIYEKGKWRLEGIDQTIIDGDSVIRRHFEKASWESLLNPEIVNQVIVQPEYLTVLGLSRYINFLRENRESSRLYEQALWVKIVRPFSILAMIVLAVPLVRGHSRFTAIGQRVFLGALIGVIFHIINQAFGHLGVVYQIPPPVSAGLPTLGLGGIVVWLLAR